MARKKKIVSAPVELGPTPERMQKGDYEGAAGKRRYRADTLLALRKAGRINSAAESAAVDWIKAVTFAGSGYVDPPEGAAEYRLEFDECGVPLVGDQITAGMMRARHAEIIRTVRQIIGDEQMEKLHLLLIEGLSFRSLAERLTPEKSVERAAQEQAVACASILSVLPGAMAIARKYQKDLMIADIDKSRLKARKRRIRSAEFTGPS